MEGQIYKAINAVMSDIGAIGKNSKNQQQGFMFRGIDAVMNAINPALIKHKIFVVPEILEQTREERTTAKGNLLIYSICKVKYTFFAEDGSFVTAIVIGEGMDSGDKATNKAMSIAFKYACFQVFCIPTEEMKDPDAECHEPEPKGKKPASGKNDDKKKEEQKNSQVGQSKSNNQQAKDKIDAIKIATLNGELQRTGTTLEAVCKCYNVNSFEEFTTENFMDAMKRFKVTPDRKKGA